MKEAGDDHNPPDLNEGSMSGVIHSQSIMQTSCIKQPKGVRVFTNHDGHCVIVKDLIWNEDSLKTNL